MLKVRRFLPWVLAAFLVYAVLVSPDRAADWVITAWDIILQGFRNIGQFFDALLGE